KLFICTIPSTPSVTLTTNPTRTKPASHHISQLILAVVAQCKHRGGISMSELKQTLSAAGYNVTKDNRRVNVVTKRLVHNETLVRTTRSAMFRRNNKVKTAKTQKPTDKTHNPAGKSQKRTNKTRKAAGRSQKQRGKGGKARRKPSKPARKKRRSVRHRAAQVRKTFRMAQRTLRRRSKKNQHLYKSFQKRVPPRRQLLKRRSRLKIQQNRINRRTYYY
uniref:H15 domain-containing protein n=1 Tax=Anabas testudineus TaxID=64144 RepID=A0A7N6B0F9_ANATE